MISVDEEHCADKNPLPGMEMNLPWSALRLRCVSVRYGAFFAESASAMSIAVTFSPMPLLLIASSNMIRQ